MTSPCPAGALDGAGIAMRPEDVDTLAEEIERDAST